MAGTKNHDYHILTPSLWPFLGALGAFIMLTGAVFYISPNVDGSVWWMPEKNTPVMFLIGLGLVLYVMLGWWTETVRENRAGDHTPVVSIGLRYGVILFIVSEVMFFVAWFWSFFKNALYPHVPDVAGAPGDGVWPPVGIETFDPWHLPLMNTLILLCSGCFATWAHHGLAHENDRNALIWGLCGAIALGILFSFFQAYEYGHAAFDFSGNVYGANFFMATGFHGFHVLVGTIFLAICLIRALRGQLSQEQHLGFEAAAWYWHFVDVVWLFLFAAIYIWGG